MTLHKVFDFEALQGLEPELGDEVIVLGNSGGVFKAIHCVNGEDGAIAKVKIEPWQKVIKCGNRWVPASKISRQKSKSWWVR